MALPAFPFWIDQKYEAVRFLGKGGVGYAVLARKKDQTVAVKLLNLTLAKNPEKVILKFKKEFLTLKKLNHPHIGQIYDFGFDANLGFYYFVSEYIEGQDILKTSRNLSVEKIETAFVQILQALHYLHTFGRAGLRHNDIKAANILATRNNKGELSVKLIDFGLSTLAPLEMRGGTASYMAPEQIVCTFPEFSVETKYPKPDERTDLYALGVVWYYCLTGLNPFLVGGDPDASLKRHFEFIPQPPSALRKEIPVYLDKIILKLLKMNPDERYASAAEVIQDLRYLSGKPYAVIPLSERRYFLPEGEWIGQEEVWKTLKAKWDERLGPQPPAPEVIWISGRRGEGKTKTIGHFKNYVQSNGGRFLLLSQENEAALEEWLADLRSHTQDFSQCLVVAVDDFHPRHPARKHLEELWQKIQYAQQWNPQIKIPWLFVLSGPKNLTVDVPLPTTSFPLRPFNLKELRDFVRRISPNKESPPPEEFVQKLLNHTRGNPLFVISILKALGGQGLLWNEEGAWGPSLFQDIPIDFSRLPVPKDLDEALKADWQTLTKVQKDFLGWTACFPDGMPADFNPGPAVGRQCVEAGLLDVDDKKRLRFRNSFLQNRIYDQLSAREKETCHEKIAKRLKEEKSPKHLIAYHLARTANQAVRRKALEILAEFYHQSGMNEEAVRSYQKLLVELPPNRLSKKLEVILQMSRLYKNMGAFESAQRFLDDWLSQIPDSAKHAPGRAALLRQKGMIFLHQNRIPTARDCLQQAFSILEPIRGQQKEKLILENTVARTFLDERRLDQAMAIYQQTRQQAQKLKPEEQREVLNNDLGYVYLLKQRNREAISFLNEDLKLFEKSKERHHLIRCHFLLGSAHRKLERDFAEASGHYQRSAELAKDMKDPDWRMRALNGLAAVYLDSAHAQGGVQSCRQALRHLEESLALCHHLKKDLATLDFETAAILLNMASCHQEMGNFVKANDILQTIITVLERKKGKESREWGRLCETYITLADNYALQKKYEEMLEPIQKGWGVAKTHAALLEHQFAVQLLWAEWAQATHRLSELKNHLGLAEKIRHKYHIQPTPLAKQRLEKLKAF